MKILNLQTYPEVRSPTFELTRNLSEPPNTLVSDTPSVGV